jgi:hypothetical protein
MLSFGLFDLDVVGVIVINIVNINLPAMYFLLSVFPLADDMNRPPWGWCPLVSMENEILNPVKCLSLSQIFCGEVEG